MTRSRFLLRFFWLCLCLLASLTFIAQYQYRQYLGCVHGSGGGCTVEFDRFFTLSKMVMLAGVGSLVVAVSNMLLENRYWRCFLPPALFVLGVSLWLLFMVPQGTYWLVYLLT